MAFTLEKINYKPITAKTESYNYKKSDIKTKPNWVKSNFNQMANNALFRIEPLQRKTLYKFLKNNMGILTNIVIQRNNHIVNTNFDAILKIKRLHEVEFQICNDSVLLDKGLTCIDLISKYPKHIKLNGTERFNDLFKITFRNKLQIQYPGKVMKMQYKLAFKNEDTIYAIYTKATKLNPKAQALYKKYIVDGQFILLISARRLVEYLEQFNPRFFAYDKESKNIKENYNSAYIPVPIKHIIKCMLKDPKEL